MYYCPHCYPATSNNENRSAGVNVLNVGKVKRVLLLENGVVTKLPVAKIKCYINAE